MGLWSTGYCYKNCLGADDRPWLGELCSRGSERVVDADDGVGERRTETSEGTPVEQT